MIRAFIALALAEKQIRDLSDLSEKLKRDAGFINLKWTKPHNYHLTLRFLGDIRESSLDELEQQLDSYLGGTSPLKFDFNKLELFPSPSKPTVMAITAQTSPQVRSCLKAIDQALHAANLHTKKVRFRPHITIARIPKMGAFVAHTETIRINRSLEFNQLELVKSQLTSEGPVYHSVYRHIF